MSFSSGRLLISTSSSFLAIPLVRRLEYLEEFLIGASEGGGAQRIQERLVARKKFFELEKSRAVGRGRPFMKKLEEARPLSEACQKMARQLGLIEGGGSLEVSSLGMKLLESDDLARSQLLVQGMLQTYVRFRRLVKALTALEGNELEVPMGESSQRFTEVTEVLNKAGLRDFNRIYFEIVLDISNQLGLANWHVKDDEPRNWVLYLTCSIAFLRGMKEDARGLLVHLSDETWRISFNSVSLDVFREQLWKDYLSLTRYVARKPVLYSNLRSRVCYSLRVSDRLFDELAGKIILSDPKYLLVGAGGTLSFRRDSASLIKSLPPKTDRGEYMVYLKMDRRT